MSNLVPGRPRRQQQAYRRANTSIGLGLDPGTVTEDPYISCASILDKTFAGNEALAPTLANGAGSSPRKNSVKDFLLGRSGNTKDLNSYVPASSIEAFNSFATSSGMKSDNPDWMLTDESVINDLTISAPRQQPKYSYLVGKSQTSHDLWRKSNHVPASVTAPAPPPAQTQVKRRSQLYSTYENTEPAPTTAAVATGPSAAVGGYKVGSSDYQNNRSAAVASSAAQSYEERINTALGRKPSTSSVTKPSSYNVQKSKSYSNFDSVRRDYNFQVRKRCQRQKKIQRAVYRQEQKLNPKCFGAKFENTV